MKLGIDYEIEIVSPFFESGTKQVWTWYGGHLSDEGFRVLSNFTNYATDCELLLNSRDNEIAGGYSLLHNDQTKLIVNKVKQGEIER